MQITKLELEQLVKEAVNKANSDQAAALKRQEVALKRQEKVNAKMNAHRARGPLAPVATHFVRFAGHLEEIQKQLNGLRGKAVKAEAGEGVGDALAQITGKVGSLVTLAAKTAAEFEAGAEVDNAQAVAEAVK